MMNHQHRQEFPPEDSAAGEPLSQLEIPAAHDELADIEKQAEYQREYFLQLRRRACPGCGESEGIF